MKKYVGTIFIAAILLLMAAGIAYADDIEDDAVYLVHYSTLPENEELWGADDDRWNAITGSLLRERLEEGMVSWYEKDVFIPFDEEDNEEEQGNSRIQLFSVSNYSGINWAYDFVNGSYAYDRGLTGDGIVVGVIDSGLKNDFGIIENTLEGYDYYNYNYAAGQTTIDKLFHGTKVSSIIANRKKDGEITGIAPNATIIPFKISEVGGIYVRYVIWAIEGAIDKYPCDVLNLSMQISENSETAKASELVTLQNACQRAIDKGIIIVAATGNKQNILTSGSSNTNVFYPSCVDGVIGVGSVDKYGNWYNGSIANEYTDISAPGAEVYAYDIRKASYTSGTGTSYASPMVAGAMALVKEIWPDITKDEVMELIRETAVDRGDKGLDIYYGYGTLDIKNVVDYVVNKKFPLTIEKSEHGSISIEDFTDVSKSSVTYKLNVTPDEHYKLSHFVVNGKTVKGTDTITVTGASTVKAVFEEKTYTLNIKTNAQYPEKSIYAMVNGVRVSTPAEVKYSDTIKIDVSYLGHTLFGSFKVNGKDTDERTFHIEEDTEVEMIYIYYNTAWAEPAVNGTLKIDKSSVYVGDTLKIEAIPDEHYKLKALYVNNEPFEGTEYIPTCDVVVSAVFEKIVYNIDVRESSNGEISVSSDTGTYGDTITVTASPDEHYILKGIWLDSGILEGDSFTVTGKHSITAEFERIYDITSSSVGKGTLSVNKSSALLGERVAISIAPEEGHIIDSFCINGKQIESVPTFSAGSIVYEIEVSDDISISAVFGKNNVVKMMAVYSPSGQFLRMTYENENLDLQRGEVQKTFYIDGENFSPRKSI